MFHPRLPLQLLKSFGLSGKSSTLNPSSSVSFFHISLKNQSKTRDEKTINIPIKVPDMGEGINFATLSRWKKHPGDECDGSDVLAELKGFNNLMLEMRPPVKGKVLEHLKQVGEEVRVGEKIAIMETMDIDEDSRLRHVVEDALDDVHILPK